MAVAHVALDLGLGDERCDRVDHHDIDGTGPDQRLDDLERLLAGVGLRDEQVVQIDAELASVDWVEGVLGVDDRRYPTHALSLGDDVQR